MNLLDWLPVATAGGLILNAVRLRDRLSGLRRVRAAESVRDDYAVITGVGADLHERVRSAAIAHAHRTGAQVLDLVPCDLPVQRVLDLARSADLGSYARNLAGPGRGAGHAMLVAPGVLSRAASAAGTLEPGEFGAATARLRQYAATAGIVVVPGPAAALAGASRRAWLRGLGEPVELILAGTVAAWMLVLAGLLVQPAAGLAALGAYCAVPYIVCAGTALKPRDLHRAALLRPVLTPWTCWRTLRGPRTSWELDRTARLDEARAHYRPELAQGVERFLERPRNDCPWCGSLAVELHVSCRDIIQAKPGRFRLDRCRDCGHVFQNPRLTVAGLDFYYRDVYDGLGAEAAERVFAGQASWYRARAAMVAAHTDPRTWLDVGTGHGHFPRTAAAVLPGTVFDGLDLGDGVAEAQRRGWIRRGYRGQFPELVGELAGRYDVISMHHYLEHTRDPFNELDTAVKVLGPGGHLLIEVPDPECVYGRLLRGFWVPWLSPQHQHLFPIENLKRALTARGMEVVAEARRSAQQGPDLPGAVLAALNLLGPDPARPWGPAPGMADHGRRVLALLLAGPLLLAAFGVQYAMRPFVRSHSNAYRILARVAAG